MPTASEKARRKKIVRKSFEFHPELDARLKVAAAARAVTQAVLVRTILTDWLLANTAQPTFTAPPAEASPAARAAGRRGAPSVFAELLSPGDAK